jgi:hypothetical protein
MNIKEFYFEKNLVTFDLENVVSIMVNATQMAKPFNKRVEDFTRLDSTKDFIKSCLKPQFAEKIGIENDRDLIVTVQKTGTWMHRILALKFAAWLNSDIDVWIHIVIDELLNRFGKVQMESIRETVKLQNEKKQLELKANKTGEDFQRYLIVLELLKEQRNVRTSTTKDLFVETSNLFTQDGADYQSYKNM